MVTLGSIFAFRDIRYTFLISQVFLLEQKKSP